MIIIDILCMITIFPTWVLVNILTRFLPKTHAWYKRKFRLLDWSDHATYYTYLISVIFWGNAILLFIFIFKRL